MDHPEPPPRAISLKTEVIAGITTFLATMYIIVVNPMILAQSGMPANGVLTATVLVAATGSILMGLYAKNPIVIAPGMGLNAFFTYSLVLGMGVPWPTALGAVFWSGVIFLVLSLTNVRVIIARAIPMPLRCAIAAGIGLFISLIGFANAGFITKGGATILSRGAFTPETLTFLFGLTITVAMVVRRIRGGLILGILLTTLASYPLGRFWGEKVVVTWQGIWSRPDFSLVGQADLAGALALAVWPAIFAFLFTDLFDSLSTFVGIAEAGDLKDPDGHPRNLRQSLTVDALATTISGLLGTSSGTSYIESAAGIEEGGRTGLTAVVAGLCFLPFLFLAPLVSLVPALATAPALVLVGVFMLKPIKGIRWDAYDEAIPAFLAMFLIPASYSITQGIIWGFLGWTLAKVVVGKKEEIPPALWIIDAFALLALVVERVG